MGTHLQETESVETMLSVKGAADILGLKRAIVSRYCQQGKLRSNRVGPVYVISLAAVRDFARKERRPGPKPKKSLATA